MTVNWKDLKCWKLQISYQRVRWYVVGKNLKYLMEIFSLQIRFDYITAKILTLSSLPPVRIRESLLLKQDVKTFDSCFLLISAVAVAFRRLIESHVFHSKTRPSSPELAHKCSEAEKLKLFTHPWCPNRVFLNKLRHCLYLLEQIDEQLFKWGYFWLWIATARLLDMDIVTASEIFTQNTRN